MSKSLLCQREGCRTCIDPQKVRKGGQKREPRYCSRECFVADRKATGFYQRLSRLGNAAQLVYKQRHGKAPGRRGGARPRQRIQQDISEN